MKKLRHIKLFENFQVDLQPEVEKLSDKIKSYSYDGIDFPVSIITGNSGKKLSAGETSGYMSGDTVGLEITLDGFKITVRKDYPKFVEIKVFGDTSYLENNKLQEIIKGASSLYKMINPQSDENHVYSQILDAIHSEGLL